MYLPGSPDGSAHTGIYLTNLVSETTVADGINIAGSANDVHMENCDVRNTGDDGYGFWQNHGDQHDIHLKDSSARNVGYRQGTQDGNTDPVWGFGTCISFFGCHNAAVDNFECFDGDFMTDDVRSDRAAGHMVTFYPPMDKVVGFGGKYDWPEGYCNLTFTNLVWLDHLDNSHDNDLNWLSTCDSCDTGDGWGGPWIQDPWGRIGWAYNLEDKNMHCGSSNDQGSCPRASAKGSLVSEFNSTTTDSNVRAQKKGRKGKGGKKRGGKKKGRKRKGRKRKGGKKKGRKRKGGKKKGGKKKEKEKERREEERREEERREEERREEERREKEHQTQEEASALRK